MSLRFILVIIISLFIVGISSDISLATDYTTGYGKKYIPAPVAQNNSDATKCTNRDIADIKSFNIRVTSKIRDYKELAEIGVAASYNDKDSRNFETEMRRVWDFFDSGEYNEMKEVYKKCGVNIPYPEVTNPYWMPD